MYKTPLESEHSADQWLASITNDDAELLQSLVWNPEQASESDATVNIKKISPVISTYEPSASVDGEMR